MSGFVEFPRHNPMMPAELCLVRRKIRQIIQTRRFFKQDLEMNIIFFQSCRKAKSLYYLINRLNIKMIETIDLTTTGMPASISYVW